ncbi:MAG: DsbA family oxidoreductase [Kurthia sp.]|nr:DsbA family oxidoreductase [Candidatus Kurthia equi]
MKIEFYADFTCPFSYMGKRRLDEVIEASEEPIEFELKAFQLTPEASTTDTMRTVDLLAKKFGKSEEETLQTTFRLRDQAKDEFNLEYNYDTMKAPNTLKAHRLTKWGAQFGKDRELTEGFFAAIFTKGLDLNKEEDLLAVIAEVGLDVEEAKKILQTDEFKDEVSNDRRNAIKKGIRSVPTYIIQDEFIVPGAKPVDVFLNAIEKAKAK